jgi:branched-chain amino acid transport system substrate-binding protein
MKKLTSVVALVLCCLLFAGFLAGCSAPAAEPETEEPAATEAPAEEQPAATEAPAASADPIKIAYIGPLTGNYETYGRHQKQALELAVDTINAAGGINGAPVEIEWNDDKSDPNETANLAYKVCDEDDVLTVFGPFTTTSALATVDIFVEAGMPVCSGSVSNADWSGMGQGRFFRGDSTTRQMCTYFADFVINKMGLKRVAMYYEQSDWGQGMYNEFVAAFEALGGEVVYNDVFQVDQKDFNASLSKFKEKDADYDLFFLVAHLNEASLLVNQLRKLGIEKTILSNNSLQDQVYLDNVGENAEGQILLSYYGAAGNTDTFEQWKTEYETRFNEKVDSHAFNTTDLIRVMFEAMKTSGDDREAFVAAMHSIKDFQGLTTSITMEENGDMTKPFSAFVVEGGEFVAYK